LANLVDELHERSAPSGSGRHLRHIRARIRGEPLGHHLGVPEAFLTLAETEFRPADRPQLQALLALWDTRALTMAGGGGFRRFAALSTADQSVGLYAGACLGGGTVVNFSTCFRTPDDVRAEWARLGVGAMTSQDYTASLDAVWDRLGVTTDHSRPSRREQVMRAGLEALGWHADLMARNVRGCDEALCGYCPFGCLPEPSSRPPRPGWPTPGGPGLESWFAPAPSD
jgi:hypothetical protein